MPSKTKQVHIFENLQVGQSKFVDGSRATVSTGVTRLNKLSPVIQHEELSLSAQAITITDSGGADGGYGSKELLTLPSAYLTRVGVMMDLTAVTAAANIAADATLALAIGSAAEATNSTLDSVQADSIASTACALTASAGVCDNAGSPGLVDATAGTSKLYLNVGVPDADISGASTVTVTGIIHLLYIDLSQGES